ncbi:MAG TPA: amino acid adenylation domain-containing protein [Longimicrobium sp.]|nr:amino acid adenylation domain-containing protein [Longimicrobium sp.]
MTELADRLAALSPAKRALLTKLRTAPAHAPIPRIADGPAPLSAEQRRLWYLLQLAPGYPLYTIPLGFRLRGRVNVDALVESLRELVARHEVLRTAFRESAGIPIQEVTDGGAFNPQVLDLRGDEWAEAEANYQTDAFTRRPYDLGAGETFHALLVREADDELRFFIGLHHLAADGWSAGVLLRELSALYAARVTGVPVDLPAPPVRYRDWAAWQQRPDREPDEAGEAYWRQQLAGAPHVLEVPPDRPRPPLQSWPGAKHPFALTPELSAGIRALARREGATPYAVAAAAYALLLRRHGATDDVLIGTLLANRPRPELEQVLGFFANTLPLRVRLDGDPTASELVRRAHAAAVGAQEHASLPFDRIVELAGVRRDFSRPPLVQAVMVFADAPATSFSLPGVAAEPLVMDSSTAAFEVTLVIEDHGDRFTGELQYATELFERAGMERFAEHFVAALEAFVADPERRISRVPLARPDEVRHVEAWSRGAPGPEGLCIHELFGIQARITPHATALVHGDQAWTYAELNRRANRIAHALRGMGVGPEARVAVCLARTPVLVATLLGVLKAGAAYVPLDPAHPPARHQAVLRASGARLAVWGDAGRAALRMIDGVSIITPAELDGGREDEPAPLAVPGNLAYVIFTSGSTGGPKGVEIEHRSAAAMLVWMKTALSGHERSSVLGSTSVTFDVSIAEIFGTLCWGGTLVMVENALSTSPRAVVSAPMVPTAAAELLREGRFPSQVETVLLGGEPVPLGLIRDLHELPAVRRVLNLYGPTEDTTYTTCAELEPGLVRVPVGRPITGGRVYVLDEAYAHAGMGTPGEVWTAGAGVARGYAHRPALTAERFRPDPHGPPGSRMYRTLDRGRWLRDGVLDYLGRADQQVKVRGYRIELEEVEQALAAHPSVAEAAATARGETGGGERRLVAYLVPRDRELVPPATELRAWVRERLPEYMVPAAFVWVDALPRTTSGKLDRRALPEHEDAAAAPRAHVAPRSELEARLAEIWREVLGVERVGVHDDFFDLGGQSILALRLVARIRDEMAGDLGVAELLQASTLEDMAAAIAGGKRRVRLPLVALQTFGERPPLFLAHPAGGHVVCYRGLAVQLAFTQPVYALQPRGVQDGKRPIPSVPEMAAYYVGAIRELWPQGPYRLGGWSFGGVVAWEMARQLEADGQTVELLALFDTAALTAEGLRLELGDPAEVVWHTVAGLAGYAAAGRVNVDDLRGLEPREQAAAMIRLMNAPQLLDETRVDDVLALTALRASNLQAQIDYAVGPYGGHLTYFTTEGSKAADGRYPGLEFWSALAGGGTTVHRVGGSHGTILNEPYSNVLAAAILALGDGG